MRLDQYLLEQGKVKTRSQAQMLIKKGDVTCNGEQILKPSFKVNAESQVEIRSDQIFVSRGAYKLLHAIEEFGLSFKNLIVADCGASTGGFTQVLLINQVQKVYAIDVGSDQLSKEIELNPKVINLENINLKHPYELAEKVDACVGDLSFISLKHVIPTIHKLLKPGGFMIMLIKPQFEVGKGKIGKNGIVSPEHHPKVRTDLFEYFQTQGLQVVQWCESPIQGKKGNIEYLVYLKDQIHSEVESY